ncbi:major capsid protein [Actinomycetospora atypica]|uniref:Major capsid protein n=1 Tax=Actinomycetospora atypica TaxID=1290095 RepID=A0ABV9YVH4_9PSEU
MAPTPTDDTSALPDRARELLTDITSLSDDQLEELRQILLYEFDAKGTPPPDKVIGEDELHVLEVLASAGKSVKAEMTRREEAVGRAHDARRNFAELVPEQYRPRVLRGQGSAMAHAVTASGGRLVSASDLSNEIITVLRTNRVANTQDGRHHIATLRVDRGPGRSLDRDDVAGTNSLTASAAKEFSDRVITAAGGLGAPEDTDYVLPGFEVVDRPVKATLPAFTATRGGVRFTRPPLISDLDGVVGVWDVEDDIAAATNPAVRKPSYRVNVGGEVVVDVQAVTNSLIFGNLLARAYPEFVSRAMDLSLAAHARVAEQQLLTQIGALSTHVSGRSHGLGATRELLPTLEVAAYGMRDRLRMGDTAPLQVILPSWTRGLLRADLSQQEPGDATLGVSNSDVDSYLAQRNVAVTYALDGEAGQNFPAQVSGLVNEWPTRVLMYMFPAGAFQFLDGGTLDLGLVRDSTLNAANDYQMFVETFEAVLFRGGVSLRISQPVSPSGVSRAAAA